MKKIYINPGHSDTDPGAVGHETERRLNVAVSNYMNEYLLAHYVCETRMNPGSMGVLATIAKDANDWGADLFVSNHFNAGGGDGYENFVYSNGSVGLGKVFEKHILAIGQNSRGVKIRPGLAVLRNTTMPAVLNEGAFVDNLKDIQDWNEEAELKKMGEAYAKAAAEYLGLAQKNTTVTQATAGEGEQLYRVRTSWDNASSQIGAYKSLENAKKACSVGYTVYDKDGKAVYTNKATSYPVDPAQSFSEAKAGTYTVSATSLNLRSGASTNKQIIETMAQGKIFTCYGYYTGDWLYGISASGKKGFCHKNYLRKK